MLKKHKWYVWGSVSLVAILSLFFIVNASASVSSPSGNINVYDNIDFTEVSQGSSVYYSENQRGKYISVVSPSALKGYANYYVYGADLELIPPNYSYTSITFILSGVCNWTSVSDDIAQWNTFTVSFAILGNNNSTIYRSASVTLNQGDLQLNIGIVLSLEEFQEIGFGINGFVVTLNQPSYSTQAIIYHPSISYRYSTAIGVTPTPEPTPTPLFPEVIPIVTPPPPAFEIIDSLLPNNEGAFTVFGEIVNGMFETYYLGGVLKLSIVIGLGAMLFGFGIKFLNSSIRNSSRESNSKNNSNKK